MPDPPAMIASGGGRATGAIVADVTVRPLFLPCSFFQSCVTVDLRAQTARLTVVWLKLCHKSAHAHNRLCMVAELGCHTLEDSYRFSSHGAPAGRVAASATDDAAEHDRVDMSVGEERQEREEEGAVGLARHGRDATVQRWRVGVGRLEVQVLERCRQREPDDEEFHDVRGREHREVLGCDL